MKTPILFLYLLLTLSFSACAQTDTKTKAVNSSNYKIILTEAEWKSKLTPEQYYILREKGTERPFTGEYVSTKEKGVYKCAGCGEALFTSEMKFDSDCGWPSFDKEIAGKKIIRTPDYSHGMRRIEITCAKCGGHLGHIFEDGPTITGKRYCVNSISLLFEPEGKSSKSVK
jgi:methionine-R-sulfoxide reductase